MIAQQELAFFIGAMNSFGMVASIIAGMAFFFLLFFIFPPSWCTGCAYSPTLLYIFNLLLCCSMGYSLLVVINTSLTTMFAPGYALRGPDGAMSATVEQLIHCRRRVVRHMVASVLCFLTAMLLFGYLLYPPEDARHQVGGDGTGNTGKAVGVMVSVGACLFAMTYYGYVDWDYFHVPSELKSTGKFMLGGKLDAEMTAIRGESNQGAGGTGGMANPGVPYPPGVSQ